MAQETQASLIAQLVKNPPAMQETQFDSWVGKNPWRRDRLPTPGFLGFPCGSAGKESACHAGGLGLIPGLGRPPGGGKGDPLQCSGLENPTDCIDHGVTKSRTGLSNLPFHFQETQTGALCQPRGVGWGGRREGGSKERGHMYTCGWLMLRFDGQQQNSESSYPSIKKRLIKKKNLQRLQFHFGCHRVSPDSFLLKHCDAQGPSGSWVGGEGVGAH